jgi:hypothetical protein
MTLDELAAKYDLTPPDEFVGPDSSRYILDYGPPVVLADSSRESSRAQAEGNAWRRRLERRKKA